MQFTFKIWVIGITIDLFDLNPSDKDIKFAIRIFW